MNILLTIKATPPDINGTYFISVSVNQGLSLQSPDSSSYYFYLPAVWPFKMDAILFNAFPDRCLSSVLNQPSTVFWC